MIAFACFANSYAQKDTNKWKAQVAFGVNSPSQSGFVEGFQAKSVNFPTVNLGIQHMFKPQVGAKLDFGFNRFSSDDNSVDFNKKNNNSYESENEDETDCTNNNNKNR